MVSLDKGTGAPARCRQPSEHDRLVRIAERWLKNRGCGVVVRDPMRAITPTGECPDALGWRDGVSILVEVKTSRADFLADQRKPFRQDPAKGMGDWRFYLCSKGVIQPADLPLGWGLVWVDGARARQRSGGPGRYGWARERPFQGNRDCELRVMYSALRRLALRGHLPEIYEKA